MESTSYNYSKLTKESIDDCFKTIVKRTKEIPYYNARTNSFDMKKGTELLFTFNSFSNTIFDKIKKYL